MLERVRKVIKRKRERYEGYELIGKRNEKREIDGHRQRKIEIYWLMKSERASIKERVRKEKKRETNR